MTTLEAIVLGVAQGLTEFLPISSTAHLRIIPAFVGWDDPGAAFTAVTQLGTLAAVLIYFRADIGRIIRSWVRSLHDPSARGDLDARLGWYIFVGTIPIGIFGFAFQDQIENGARNLSLIGSTLIALGLVLLAAERVGKRDRPLEAIRRRDGLLIGLAQAVALIPGVSRSGATITAGLFAGLTREGAARFSFLLSIPAVVLSGMFGLVSLDGAKADAIGTGPLAIATAVAFVVGYLSIAVLLRFLTRHSTLVFVAYRVGLGVVVLALAGSGVIE